jgi:hypothetical protein
MPTTVDTTGRPAYMYDSVTDTWYQISGKVSTTSNYAWTGTHQWSNTVTANGNFIATLRINCFTNPAARTAAIAAPGIGLITFIQQDAGGNTVNRFEYWNGTAWIVMADLSSTQTLTNKTLTSPTINTPTISNGSVTSATITNPTLSGTMAGSVTFSGNNIFSGNVDITGRLDVQEIRETLTSLSLSGSTLTVDYNTTGNAVLSSPASNFTINVTNVPTDNNKAIDAGVIVSQGATARIPTAFQIDGVAQTIRWVAGITPTGTANKIDVFSFTMLRQSNAWTVLGQGSLNF